MKKPKKKTLVVYYSRSGNTRQVAKDIAKKMRGARDKIRVGENYDGFLGAIKGSWQALTKKEPDVKSKKNPSEYKLTIIGTPIWAGTMASPVRTYLSNHKFHKVAFFCTYGGGQTKKVFRGMEKLTKRPVGVLPIRGKRINSKNYKDEVNSFCKLLKERR